MCILQTVIITALCVYHFVAFVTAKENQTKYFSALSFLNSSAY